MVSCNSCQQFCSSPEQQALSAGAEGTEETQKTGNLGGWAGCSQKKPLQYLTNFFAAAQLEQTNFRYSFSSFSVSLSFLSALVPKNYICLLLINKPLTSVNWKKLLQTNYSRGLKTYNPITWKTLKNSLFSVPSFIQFLIKSYQLHFFLTLSDKTLLTKKP